MSSETEEGRRYVRLWLHAKASLAGWRRYLNSTAGAALAKNSLLSLSAISFLAVFREGAETVIFYIGIAPSISTGDLLLGVGIAFGLLVVFGSLVFTFGMRVPVAPFLRVTSILIYYLAFKFVGTGVHSLQVAGKISATHADYLPANDFIGLYPTWETAIGQIILLLLGAGGVLYMSFREKQSLRRREGNRGGALKETTEEKE